MNGQTWLTNDFAHVRDLVSAGFAPTEAKAHELLRRAGLVSVAGVFAREAFNRAFGVGAAEPPSGASPVRAADSISVASRMLDRFHVRIDRVVRGKTTLVTLSSHRPVAVRSICESPETVLVVGTGATARRARVYAAAARRSGAAQFSVSGFLEADAPELYLLVLVDEPHVWIARREDLVEFDAEARKVRHVAGKRRQNPRQGFAPVGLRPGNLRVWIPKKGFVDLELHERFVDPKTHRPIVPATKASSMSAR